MAIHLLIIDFCQFQTTGPARAPSSVRHLDHPVHLNGESATDRRSAGNSTCGDSTVVRRAAAVATRSFKRVDGAHFAGDGSDWNVDFNFRRRKPSTSAVASFGFTTNRHITGTVKTKCFFYQS